MALMRREHFEFPELRRRFFEPDFTSAWMRVEEFIDGDALVVRAEREEKSEHKAKQGYRSEFHYGAFERSLPLSAGTKEEDVSASYRDGILEIRVPMREEKPATTRVQITRS